MEVTAVEVIVVVGVMKVGAVEAVGGVRVHDLALPRLELEKTCSVINDLYNMCINQ